MADLLNVNIEQPTILRSAPELISTISLSEEVKQALLECFEHVAWVDEYGQDYYDALYDALYPPANLVSISAVYTQSGTVYDTDSLDSLKSDLVVTAHYSDQSTQTITTYTLSGTLAEGTSTITVSYGGKTTTFDVVVVVAVPLYALPDKVTTTSDYKLTTSANGHVEFESLQNWTVPAQGQGLAINLQTGVCSATSMAGVNNQPMIFALNANDVVEWGTENMVNALSTTYSGGLRQALSSQSVSGLSINSADGAAVTITGTVSSNVNVWYPIFYLNTGSTVQAGTKLIFDMFVKVNNVRYV